MNTKRAMLVLLGYATVVSAQTEGTITGTVVDESNRPLAKVKVFVEAGGFQMHKTIKYWETDSAGNFTADHLTWGTYSVNTVKVEDGYGDTSTSLHYTGGAHTVTLSPQTPLANIPISLGPREGRIMAINVSDSTTGKPVGNASVKLSRIEPSAPGEPRHGGAILTSVIFRPPLLVPARASVEIKISAPGYADWYYPGTGDPSKAELVVFQPDEQRTFNVLLQPLLKN